MSVLVFERDSMDNAVQAAVDHEIGGTRRRNRRRAKRDPGGGKTMNGPESRALGVALATLLGALAAQAQEVHKCTVNGAVAYQSTPCPSGDVVMQAPPTPSDQETRQARSDLSRQRYQAATGRLMHPAYVPPPPPPPPPLPSPPAATATTTIIMTHGVHNSTVIIRQSGGLTAPAPPPPLAPPKNNCEKLNRDNNQAVDRRDQLRAPSELASHDELLGKAEAEVSRIAQLAAGSNCRLTR